ncbi:MAG: methanethiol S-methyltransferase [Pseudomonadota bacterium]
MGILRLGFAVGSYLLFFLSFLYLIAFTGNLFDEAAALTGLSSLATLPSIDVGPDASLGTAIIVNLALIALFGIQHSVMARPAFKRWLTRFWPAAIERSLYVLATVAVLVAIFLFWRPIAPLVWSAEAEWLRILLWALFVAGWVILFIATWLLSHFELFGLHQAWADFRGKVVPEMQFRTPLFYKLVRHPIYTGILLAFWATPDMSQGHLLFAAGMTVYVVIGVRYEERDLIAHLGEQYIEYRTRVGAVIPGIGKAR